MNPKKQNIQLISKLLFRLLPIQILLAAVSAVNGIVSGLFASNFIGEEAMSAVALYAPVTQILSAVNLMLVGGSQILCGQYMGRNQKERANSLFSLDLIIAGGIAVVIVVLLLPVSLFDLTRFAVADDAARALFNRYILGQTIGVIPLMLGQQMAAFLSLENCARRTTSASLVFIAVNFILNYVFVVKLEYGAFGLALASSLGLWAFFLIQLEYFVRGRGLLRFKLRGCRGEDAGGIFRIGLPGSLSQGYQTIRRLVVNSLVMTFVGSVGLSAFAASDMLLGIVWAVPNGMLAVSRMMMSISIGEEDRRTLADVMRVLFRRFVPLMAGIAVVISACAVPLTRLFYQDMTAPVFGMSVWGFRLLPLCMPLSLIYMHFVCYGQESGKDMLVHILSILDGVVCVAGFSAILVPLVGVRGVFEANILNGIVTTLVILGYAFIRNRRAPRTMEELMVIPEDFGVPDEQRMDLSVKSMDEVVSVSEAVQAFCTEQGIDERRARLSGLCMEEMAGNVVSHGFVMDKKDHTVDVRIVRREDSVILRIRDDCIAFNPAERLKVMAPAVTVDGSAADDIDSYGALADNIGIRMVYAMAQDVSYQSILGLNVLTIRI